MIKPKKIGQITIKASARSSRAGDSIQKILKVEPEGMTVYESSSILIDLRDKSSFKGNMSVVIPKNSIPDSASIEVNAVGKFIFKLSSIYF